MIRLTQFLICTKYPIENRIKICLITACSFLYVRLLSSGTYCNVKYKLTAGCTQAIGYLKYLFENEKWNIGKSQCKLDKAVLTLQPTRVEGFLAWTITLLTITLKRLNLAPPNLATFSFFLLVTFWQNFNKIN